MSPTRHGEETQMRDIRGVGALAVLAVAAALSGGAASAWPSSAAVPTRHHEAATRAAAPRHLVRISFAGDTILGMTPTLPAHPLHYLAPVRKLLSWRHGIGFGNLEGTLTTQTANKCGGSSGGTCFAFRNPPHYARYLAAAGFSILNDANNHSHDFGAAGLSQTIHASHKAGMKQTGLPGQFTVVHTNCVRIAFVGFAPYSTTADLLRLDAAKALIHKASRHASVVVVYMHAGAEGTGAQHVTGHEETYLGEDRGNPKRFAHLAVRAGADLVLASGPHVLRGMQFYRHHLIAYSLGNFANFHNFGGGGVLSDSGVLHVTLTSSGGFRFAQLHSVHLDSTGRASPGGGSVAVVRRLSKDDFGHRAVLLSRHGVITRR
jgi:poly-gamma-glutamate capsule biosynthesis protein CapA/YwtB (metallophosphatase superfamily)